MRFCEACKTDVHASRSRADDAAHARAGHCIAQLGSRPHLVGRIVAPRAPLTEGQKADIVARHEASTRGRPRRREP